MSEEKKKYITLQIQCVDCKKQFTNRPEITSDAEGVTETVVDCIHCGKPNKITIPRCVEPQPEFVIRGIDP